MKRFWNKVDKTKNCWEWRGAHNQKGYGRFHLESKTYSAHRISAFWAGILPNLHSKLFVCHQCDNPSCVNPQHLFVGTQKDNMQDCIQKGRRISRGQQGVMHPKAKLLDQDILEMRSLYKQGNITYQNLGIRFHISKSQAYKIVNKRSWTHI